MPRDKIRLSAASVHRAGLDFRDALAGGGLELATEKLALAAEQSLGQFDETATMAFESIGAEPTSPRRQEATEEMLAAALGQFQVANTLLAASTAVGEEGEAQPAALDRSLQQLDETVAMFALAPREVPLPAAEAPTGKEAAAALRSQVSTTLGALTKRSMEVMTVSITGVRDGGPQPIRDLWAWAKEKVRWDEIGGRLAKLGLRALQGALDLLNRAVPSQRLDAVRERVGTLIEKAVEGSPGLAVLGMVLGADEASRQCEERLSQRDLDPVKLGAATAELAGLRGKHDKVMDLCGLIGTAVGFAAPAALLIKVVIPQLHLIILGAHLLLVAAIVVIGREYVEATRTTVGEVTG